MANEPQRGSQNNPMNQNRQGGNTPSRDTTNNPSKRPAKPGGFEEEEE